jgi:hypothetical protein
MYDSKLLKIKHFALRTPTKTSCELSLTTDESGHQVFDLSFSQIRLLVLEGARILATWVEPEK